MAFKSAQCFIIMSDINNLESVRNIENYLKDLMEGNVDLNMFPIIFSLNKIDKLNDKYQEDEALKLLNELIEKYQVSYGTIVKTSAINNINVDTLFRDTANLHFTPKRSIEDLKKYIKEHNEEYHKHKKCTLM